MPSISVEPFLFTINIVQNTIIHKLTYNIIRVYTRVGISGTTAKSRQRKFVPSSHPGPFAVVATSRKSQTKVGTLACFDLL